MSVQGLKAARIDADRREIHLTYDRLDLQFLIIRGGNRDQCCRSLIYISSSLAVCRVFRAFDFKANARSDTADARISAVSGRIALA